mgnify:CR=1 FL=1
MEGICMVFDLKPIFNNEGLSVSFDYTIDLSALSHGGVNPINEPVRVFGSIKNTTGIVSVDAETAFTYKAICDRCANEVTKKFKLPITRGLICSRADSEDEGGDYITVEDMLLDFDEIATEEIVLNLPNKFLCKESCMGLCPICGIDLNLNQCNCKEPIDPRLEGLLQFLD